MLELGLGLAAVFSGLFGILVGVAIMGLVVVLLLVPYFLFSNEAQSLPAIDAAIGTPMKGSVRSTHRYS